MVLDVDDWNYNPGTQIINYTKKSGSSADNELWYFVDARNGQYTIHSKINGLAIDVKNSGGSGTPVVTEPANGTPSQKWSLQFQGTAAFIASALGKDLVLDVKGANVDAGAYVQVYTKKEYDTDNQLWEFLAA